MGEKLWNKKKELFYVRWGDHIRLALCFHSLLYAISKFKKSICIKILKLCVDYRQDEKILLWSRDCKFDIENNWEHFFKLGKYINMKISVQLWNWKPNSADTGPSDQWFPVPEAPSCSLHSLHIACLTQYVTDF